ncbi:MAG: hypothetical protein WD060_12210 [Pirellulales bacterium]
MHARNRTVVRCLLTSCCLLVALILATAAAAVSEAETIYDTTSSTTLLDIDVSPAVKQATRFQTTASEFIVTGMSFQLKLDDSGEPPDPATGILNWLIYTDNGELPVLPIPGGPIFDLDVSTLSAAYSTVSTGPLNVSLSPLTTYWLVLNGQSLTSGILQVQEALNPTGTGSPFGAASSTTGTSWSGHSSQAAVGTITAVPEPGPAALAAIGAGLVSLMWWRRLRTAPAAA